MNFGSLKEVLEHNKGENRFSFVAIREGVAQLTDPDPKNDMLVRLTHIPRQGLVMQLPGNQPGYFKKEYKKICDHFIIVPRDDGADVVLCEMKTTLSNGKHSEARRQIKCSIPLFWYVKEALTTHYGEDGEIRMHYAIFADKIANMASMNTTHGSSRARSDDAGDIGGKQIRVFVNDGDIPVDKLYA